MNLMANIGKSVRQTCFFYYHNDDFLVWQVKMQDFQKSKVKIGIIPHSLRREKMQEI